jgi:hypothetical protein
MVTIQLTAEQLRIIRSSLLFVFEEIEDDAQFEEIIGATRWEAEELRLALPSQGGAQ